MSGHSQHEQMVINISDRRNRGATGSSSRPGNKHQKLPESNMWPAGGEQMQTFVHNMNRQWIILYLDVRY